MYGGMSSTYNPKGEAPNTGDFLAEYKRYIAESIKQGRVLTKYPCPHCLRQIKTAVPDANIVRYQTTVDCPFCKAAYLETVRSDGTVITTEPDNKEKVV